MIDGYAQTLASGRTRAAEAVGRIGAGVWTGEAASAFCTTADGRGRGAVPVIAAWDRVAAALRLYAQDLSALQEEGDAVRRSLTAAEDELTSLLATQRTARTCTVDSSWAVTAQAATVSAKVTLVRAEVASCWSRLEDIAARRRDLDLRAAGRLADAPGPGGAAWAGIAYTADGRRLPDSVVLDDLLDRLGDGDISEADLELLRQVLATCSNDPAWCAALLSGLGADGLVDVLDAASAQDDDPDGTAAASLLQSLTSALASASTRWSAQQNQEFGVALLDAIDSDTSHVLVPQLFTGSGLDPQMAVGALNHLEQLRTDDPDRFTALADAQYPGVAAVGGYGIGLAAALFAGVAGSPADALAFLSDGTGADTDRIRYWFGERDWTFDGFEGPATLLAAIANAPAAQQARADDPFDPLWVQTTEVVSAASQGLGGNVHLSLDHLTPQASLDIARALATYAPEIAAGLVQGFGGSNGKTTTVTVLSEDVPALTISQGNLSRLLGIATVDTQALSTFTAAVGDHAARVVDWVTADDHPSASDVQDVLREVGALYGLTYASYGLEDERNSALVSDAHQAAQDFAFTVFGALPGVESGSAVLDAVIDVGVDVGLDNLADLVDDGILTQDQLDAITQASRGAGTEALAKAVTDQIAERWDAITPSYATPDATSGDVAYATPEKLTAAMSTSCDTYANAFANDNSSGDYDVTLADGTTRARKDM